MVIIDRISNALAALAAWAFVLIGLMLGYEVVARYFFNAPTIWAEEMSRMLLVWASFGAVASLLRNDQHIRVTVVTDLLGPAGQRVARIVSLVFVLAIAVFIAWYGAPIAWDSFTRGRSTGTMMNLPSWWSQAAVPVSFALLALQALVEIVRTARGDAAPTHQDATE